MQGYIQVVLAMRGKSVGLGFGEDVEEIVVGLRDLGVQVWVGRGRGKGGRDCRGRRGLGRGGRGVGEEGWEGGRGRKPRTSCCSQS